jgi:hypothetical protein
VRAWPATLAPVEAGRELAVDDVVSAAAAVSVVEAGGGPAQPASEAMAATAAQRSSVEVKSGDRGAFMKVSLSGKRRPIEPMGQRSTDDYFSTILKFATP